MRHQRFEAPMSTTLTAYTLFTRTIAANVPEPSGDATVEAEVTYWRETIRTISTVEELTSDERLYAFATTAFGFTEEDAPLPVLAQLAFEGGASDLGSKDNAEKDTRLEEMVRQFAFNEFGLSSARDPFFIGNIEQRYRAAVNQNPLLQTDTTVVRGRAEQEADYFRTRIGGIDSPDELLADFQLYQYSLTAFGLESYASNPFQIRQVLAEGAGDSTDLAVVLGDPKLEAFTRAFGFDSADGPNVTEAQFAESIITRNQRATGTIESLSREGETDQSVYFRENIGKISSAEDLLADRRLYTYVMTAFDLSGAIDQPGIIRKVLEEGTADEDDFTNRLPDPRYRAMAKVLAFAEFGLRNVQDPGVVDQIVDRYERVQREIDAGRDNPAVELAAYFDRKAETVTEWIQVLADSRLRSVTFTALGIPQEFNVLGTSKLIEELEARYDIADFQNPERREAFIERYAVLNDVATGFSTGATSGSVAGLFQPALNGASVENLYSLVIQL